MKFPEFLNQNGTIGFVAPSFGCNIEPYMSAFKAAQDKFIKLGHSLDFGPNCYAGEGIGISNTPDKCGEELTDGYVSEKNDVLISCGGGELMCEILDYVDFEKIKQSSPKWFMGYSDNTNFTFLLNTICDVASIYAPCAATFGMEPWHESIQDAYDLICGRIDTVKGYDKWEKQGIKDETRPTAPYNTTEKRFLRCYDPVTGITNKGVFEIKEELVKDEFGIENFEMREVCIDENVNDRNFAFEGRLVGGCLDCLKNLVGTKYDQVAAFNERYKEEGVVWFLEACDLNVMDMRRAVWQLDHAGWFKNVKGFVIGRPAHFNEGFFGLDQYDAITYHLAKYNVPIIMDADLGHKPPMMPVIGGSHVKVKVEKNDITLKFDCN